MLSRVASWKWFLLSFFGGGIVFWIPDLVIPALDRNEQGYAVTVACPIVLILFYAAVLRLRRTESAGPSTAICAVWGMWVLALSFTQLAGGIRSQDGLGGFSWGDLGYLLVSSFLPTRIVELVTLEGSIFALLLGTAALLICHTVFERTRWILPPGIFAAMRRTKN